MLSIQRLVVFLVGLAAGLPAFYHGVSAGPQLDVGRLYKFSYKTALDINRPRGSSRGNVGFQVSSEVDISLTWRNPENHNEQLLRVQISNVQIQNSNKRSRKNNIFHGTTAKGILGRERNEALQRPFLILWKMGKVRSVYMHKAEPVIIKNLKRGVASMLMLQLKSGKMMEVLGVGEKSSSVTLITLEGSFIKSAVTKEMRVLSVNAHHTTAVKVLSEQSLTLLTVTDRPAEVSDKDIASAVKSSDPKLVSVGVITEKSSIHCKTCSTLMDTWRAEHAQLEPQSLAKSSAPRSFLTLIHSLRLSSKDQILSVLKNCSKTALPQLVDAVTSAQTPDSLSAMLEFLDFSNAKSDSVILQERFLYACGFASHPTESMLQALLDISNGKIGSTDIKESVVIIMGALVKKLCQKGGCELPVVTQVKQLILTGPGKAEDEAQVQMYLLALKNALLPEAIPLLTQLAEFKTGALSTIAITALHRYDPQLITQEVKQMLNRVYHQNRRVYEKNVRAAAADVILSSDPSYEEVKNLLLSIGHLPHEMNKYMVSKVEDILRFSMPASKKIREVMKNTIVQNYDRFSKMGSSSAYSGYMTRGTDVTATYSLDILYSGSGILRRSNMNIYGQSNNALLHGLQVAIEAQGLESLIAVTADEGEEDLESFAGMSALLMDVQLRPVTFFKGYSDLMSKMFSMSGDPINVVKGLILLTDHSQVIPLQSGLRVAIEFQGGLAIDISGAMEFSLWYRESKTSVNNRGALVVVGNVTVDVDFLSVGMEVSFETEAALDFITTVQFSEYPFLVCMQMDKTTFPFREAVYKIEKLSSGEPYIQRRDREQIVPGSEFPLHQENSNMCKKVFDSSW
ncbi:Microsomal triglyceride transfer protein [Bagarius yarrelli]|uniref:Microsomal triglyceride transfer protein n=1 Tax=Bagarius yarrelli TaxID=175774 RepID=A0A556U8B4_BAGYA|nr:Microsomal triglyceride transfer protein [Bagarius yarrelli]